MPDIIGFRTPKMGPPSSSRWKLDGGKGMARDTEVGGPPRIAPDPQWKSNRECRFQQAHTIGSRRRGMIIDD